jgi:hypothetical protein
MGLCFFMKLHLLFDPRREHLPSRPQKIAAARAQGQSRLAAQRAATRQGLGLDWPEHGGKIGWSGTEPAGLSNFKPVVFDHFCAAANIGLARRTVDIHAE